MVFAWLILEAVGDSMLTRLRKEKNFKNPSMDTFPSKYFPHHVLTFVRKERGIKSYKVEIWIPTHWLADVLVTDSSETKWSRSETHVDGEAINIGGYKMNQTISDLLKCGPDQLIIFVVLFTRPVFQATDLIIELASTVWPVVTCLLGTMVIWSFGQWSNTRRGGSEQLARFCTRMYFLLFTKDFLEVHIVLGDFNNS